MINEQTYRWEDKTKYYQAHIGYDLLGDLIVTFYYGNKNHSNAKRISYPVKSLKKAYALIEEISQNKVKFDTR